MYMIRNSYHCRDCGVCIKGYDHHCPWVSKCIGHRNLKSFYAFVGATPLFLLYAMIAFMFCVASAAVKHNQVNQGKLLLELFTWLYLSYQVLIKNGKGKGKLLRNHDYSIMLIFLKISVFKMFSHSIFFRNDILDWIGEKFDFWTRASSIF